MKEQQEEATDRLTTSLQGRSRCLPSNVGSVQCSTAVEVQTDANRIKWQRPKLEPRRS